MLALLVYIFVSIYRKGAITPRNITGGLVSVASLCLVVFATCQVCFALDVFEPRITNMQLAYDQFGVVSCFTRSALERGIDEPEEYSEDVIDEILEELPQETPTPSVTPNIIVIQLESFFDPAILLDTTFSENPTPTFSHLTETCSSGALYVPVVGAGTANTEFEVLTGMNVDFFGTGEYPYETILQEHTCESMAYNLKELGYATTAMHNNTGTFYQRNTVYPNLGFDTFVSSEYMADTTTTPQGWIRDECLTGEIVQSMEATQAADFVFAVSVQGHGPFPEEEDDSLQIKVTSSPFEEELENQLEYYVNQLYDMDCFVTDLLEVFSAMDEPVVLVLYGDHMPSLPLECEDLSTGDTYQTSYVIWANYDLDTVDEDLSTYQLSAQTLSLVGIETGTLTKFHQECAQDGDYLDQLEILQYDMLYGEEFYNEETQLLPTQMTMGSVPITLEGGYQEGEFLYFQGDYFTDSSVVFVNDHEIETLLTPEKSLQIAADEVEEGDIITVRQVSPSGVELSQSTAFIWMS